MIKLYRFWEVLWSIVGSCYWLVSDITALPLFSYPLSFSFLFWASAFPFLSYVLLSFLHSIHVPFHGSGPHRFHYGRAMGIDFKKTTTGLKVAWFQPGGKPKTLPDPHNPVFLILYFILFFLSVHLSLSLCVSAERFPSCGYNSFKACTTCRSHFSLFSLPFEANLTECVKNMSMSHFTPNKYRNVLFLYYIFVH